MSIWLSEVDYPLLTFQYAAAFKESPGDKDIKESSPPMISHSGSPGAKRKAQSAIFGGELRSKPRRRRPKCPQYKRE